MAKSNFLNENSGRSFPFLDSFQEVLEQSFTAPFIAMPNSAILDFGSTMGVLSYYQDGMDSVYLSRVSRESGKFIFEFQSTAGGLAGQVLRFERLVGTTEIITEYSDVESADPEQSASASTTCPVDDSLWEGYLVTGDLRDLEDELTANGMEMTGDSDDAVIEPALIQNLSQQFLRSVNLANSDRTRVSNPVECIQPVLPFTQEAIYVNKECMLGDIRWKAGYNCVITQSDVENSITINGEVAGGEGEPCDEVPLFAGEIPATDSTLLTGGPGCNEVIRSINGVGGRVFDVQGGDGVDVTADPDNHQLTVNFSMTNLALCFEEADPEESNCAPEESNTLCGELP